MPQLNGQEKVVFGISPALAPCLCLRFHKVQKQLLSRQTAVSKCLKVLNSFAIFLLISFCSGLGFGNVKEYCLHPG